MIDLTNLDRYVVILTGSQALDSVEDLRELEGDFGPGVYTLWSDEQQSIVAFAFEPALYKEDTAQAWVKSALEQPEAKAASAFRDVLLPMFQAVVTPIQQAVAALVGDRDKNSGGEGLRSFDDIRELVRHALDAKYPGDEKDIDGGWLWIVEIGTERVIVETGGNYFSLSYWIDENSIVTLGPLEPAEKTWITKADNMPILLHAFSVQLGDGDAAEAEAEDGEENTLIWKELVHPGTWFKSDTGREVSVTLDIIKATFEAWKAGLPKLISVPTDSHHDQAGGIIPAEKNRGFIRKLKIIGDALFGGFEITDPEVAYGVQTGSIADCSIYIQHGVVHPETGKRYPWILEHVLLTNSPLAQDLQPFGAIPASSANRKFAVEVYEQTQEDEKMGNNGNGKNEGDKGVTLSAQDAEVYQEFNALGLSVGDVQAMVAERAQVLQQARGLEVTKVVRALEGVEDHPGVVKIDGTRHWPVVCAAVEKALSGQPKALALDANSDGQTELDAVVLAVVNSIPADGRMALSTQPTGDREPGDPELEGDTAKPPSDDQIRDFASSLHPHTIPITV